VDLKKKAHCSISKINQFLLVKGKHDEFAK